MADKLVFQAFGKAVPIVSYRDSEARISVSSPRSFGGWLTLAGMPIPKEWS